MKATMVVNLPAFQQAMAGKEANVARAETRILERVSDLGQIFARRFLVRKWPGTGRLHAAILTEVKPEEHKARVYVDETAAPHGRFVERGTGLYGPYKQVIKPINGDFLVFRSPRDGKLVFVREIKGMRAKRYMAQAHRTLEGIAQAESSRILAEELSRGGGT